MHIFEELYIEAKIRWGPKSAIIKITCLRVIGEGPTK